MNPKLADDLHASYPQLLTQPSGRPVEMRIGNGWFALVGDLFFLLDRHRQSGRLRALRVVEVKQKFGALRVYVSVTCPLVQHLLDSFELLSTRRCECRGLHGRRRVLGGGVFTLCDANAQSHSLER